jgi:hypothetical protein
MTDTAGQQTQVAGSASGGSSAKKDDSGPGSAEAKAQPPVGNEEPKEFRVLPGRDNSVQAFGSEARRGKARAVVAAMRSFLSSVAVGHYRAICARLTGAARGEIEQVTGDSCASGIRTIMAPQSVAGPAAMAAGRGHVSKVRLEGGTAFVLFTPRGGGPSFFVMKREGGEWRATGVTTGQELNREG